MMLSPEQLEQIMIRRHKIVVDYCRKKGWPTDLDNLEMEQIMEIRSQQDWIDVPKLISEGK